jgi:hypothetical protein
MTISTIANVITFPIGIVCLIISLRAFHVYRLSRNEVLFILGLSMASIAAAAFSSTVGELHIGGTNFNWEWTRAFGSCSGGLFLLLSSMVKSHEQLQMLKRWQIITAIAFIIVILLTPLYPRFASPFIPAGLFSCRIIIYGYACIRYTTLYISKATRFSLIMSAGFLLLAIGFGFNIPGVFQSGLAAVTILGAAIRTIGYISLLLAYSVG